MTMAASKVLALADELAVARSYYELQASLAVGQDVPRPVELVAEPGQRQAKASAADKQRTEEPTEAAEDEAVPWIKLSALTRQHRARFNALMEKHSFVVLTDLGDKLERTYAALMAAFEAFFTSEDTAAKDKCTSKHVYRNENGTPMWYCGYEHTSVRDCFRVACGDMSRLVWPDEAFERLWRAHQRAMQQICDQALSLTLGYKVAPAPQRADVDFSVCYGLHYPNTSGSGQSERENVFEHVDPSLYVAEPVPSVEGLDVFDLHSQQWISAENVCVPGKEIVLFCGKALQRCTDGRIKGTLHRVRRTPDRRFCVIYEQKYEEFFLD